MSGWQGPSLPWWPQPRSVTLAAAGGGAVIDVSIYESMVVAMGCLSAMSASVLGDDSLLTQRSLELPSIVPTADGMIGFCTITAQQFQDFLVLIDRPGPSRRRRACVDGRPGAATRRIPGHGSRWTADKTTDEIIEMPCFPNPRGADRYSCIDHEDRPLRRP